MKNLNIIHNFFFGKHFSCFLPLTTQLNIPMVRVMHSLFNSLIFYIKTLPVAS